MGGPPPDAPIVMAQAWTTVALLMLLVAPPAGAVTFESLTTPPVELTGLLYRPGADAAAGYLRLIM